MRNKNKIILTALMLALLIVTMMVLVACVGEKDTPPVVPPTDGAVSLVFTAEQFDGAQYNGETGVANDMYTAKFKGILKVDQGEANASFAIKAVEIKRAGGEYITATASELKKFTLLDTDSIKVTTDDVSKTFRVQFGDFSDRQYYGAQFKITIEGVLSAIPVA